jgi:major capsid protein E
MPISLSIYDVAPLVEVVRNLKLPSQFLLKTFFPTIIEYATREFAIDVDAGKRRLAPFVSPLVQGRPVESRGISTSLFALAYIKDKRGLDPFRPVQRVIGEHIGGGLSATEREMANLSVRDGRRGADD